ncbi:MAG: fibronectin type III domain-containing protein, partial [Aquihabitans sp.]
MHSRSPRRSWPITAIAGACLAVALTPASAVAAPRGGGPQPAATSATAPLELAEWTTPAAVVGRPYTATLRASGGVPPYTWSNHQDPANPSDFTVSPTGVVTGTPRSERPYFTWVYLTDGLGTQVLRSFRTDAVGPPQISTDQFADGFTGTAYDRYVFGWNGIEPYTFGLASGSLPPGLQFRSSGPDDDRVGTYLSGTPAAAGTWRFTLRITDAAGQSSTGPAEVTVHETTPPGAPTGVYSDRTFVAWDPPELDGGAPVTGYVVTPYRDDVALAPITTTGLGLDLDGALRAGTYRFSVAAVNRVGTGPASALSEPGPIVTAPDAPTGLTATRGDRSVVLTWTPPFDGGGSIRTYVIQQVDLDDGHGWNVGFSSVPSFSATGLDTGPRAYRVFAESANGVSAPSATVSVAIIRTAPSPGAVAASPRDHGADVRWEPPRFAATDVTPAVTSYLVTPYLDGVGQAPTSVPASAASARITGLVNGASYTFRVASVNGATSAPSDPSNAVVPSATPIVPSAPSPGAVVPGDGSARVSWTLPQTDGGSPITGYRVTPYAGGTALAPQVFSSAALVQTVTGLANGTAYTFRIAAVNAAGTGPPSEPTEAVPVGSPAAPTGVTGVPGATSVLVSWTAPASNGAPITASIITPYRYGVAQPTIRVEGSATSLRVANLERSVGYTFRVRSENARGFGPQSGVSGEVRTATPLAPTSIQVVPGATSALLTWNAPGPHDEPVTTYGIVRVVGSSQTLVAAVPGPATSTTVTGLAPGTHQFQIIVFGAVDGGATSAVTAPVTVV